jgi:ATP-dependent 26S proteasome regulatory subunit
MIDGSINTEPPTAFFDQFQQIVKLAKENSPSVLFIDDADVLFGIHHVAGLVRYLLSLLDGLESESAGSVCVMMTAMDARRVPDALLRSGRVELWLETRTPDLETRGRILERWTKPGLPGKKAIDYKRLSAMTEGFTPADLRRIAADARLLYAGDLVDGRKPANATDYMVNAVQDIIDVRARMTQAIDECRAAR